MKTHTCIWFALVILVPNIIFSQSTYTVNSILDTSDNNPGDNLCDDGSGNCTLRAAMEEVESNASGGDFIEFGFSISTTIQPASDLPEITVPNVTVDGTTAGSSSCGSLPEESPHNLLVTIDGSSIASNSIFNIQESGATIKGLILINSQQHGIDIDADDITISCNYIGTDGTNDFGSNNHGINLASSLTGITIHNNVISGNGGRGINSGFNTELIITGNLIGTNELGNAAISNVTGGIYGSIANSIIGGATGDLRNIISGNGQKGFYKPTTISSNVIFENNYIGVDITGLLALGNAHDGLNLRNLYPASIVDNVISANGTLTTHAGIQVANQTILTGNKIGTDKNGVGDFGNAGSGVLIRASGSSNTIGGNVADANIIAFNGVDGIEMSSTTSGTNLIQYNSIYSNAGLGIDLGSSGVTPNDSDDSDSGANNLQNFPEVSKVTSSGGKIYATFKVASSTSNAAYPLAIDFYEADADGEEGQTYIGSVSYESADAESVVTQELTVVSSPSIGASIIATATDANGNTSEFSTPAVILPVELISFTYSYKKPNELKLQWITASETNNMGFEVLSSIDGQYWETEGWVDGNGTSSDLIHYSYKAEPKSGICYYRLKQVDFNGESELHEIIQVYIPSTQIQLFPTIIKDNLHLLISQDSKSRVYVLLRDVQGRLIQSIFDATLAEGIHQLSFLLDDSIPNGTYFIEVKHDQAVYSERVMVER